jgi:hypothetical protein
MVEGRSFTRADNTITTQLAPILWLATKFHGDSAMYLQKQAKVAARGKVFLAQHEVRI